MDMAAFIRATPVLTARSACQLSSHQKCSKRLRATQTPARRRLPVMSKNQQPSELLTASPPQAPPPATFHKYHGIGNDFILIDNRHTSTPVLTPSQSVLLCDRHKGIGADGVIFLLPPQNPTSDIMMRLHNADGSEPEMCGNGIRCLARFATALDVPSRTDGIFVVDTFAGPIVPKLVGDRDVCVDMGEPILTPADIPTTLNSMPDVGYVDTLPSVAGADWNVTCVSMGNPHAIIFVTEQQYATLDATLETVGPQFENHPVFPARTNTEFIFERSRVEFDMLVWERGSGRTMACGTGACAVAVAAVLTGRSDRDSDLTIHLPGGDLIIRWETASNKVLMTGPAELVFEGRLPDF